MARGRKATSRANRFGREVGPKGQQAVLRAFAGAGELSGAERLQSSRQAARRSGANATRCWPVRADEPWGTRLRLSPDVNQSSDATARGRQAASRAEQCDAKLARRDNEQSLR